MWSLHEQAVEGQRKELLEALLQHVVVYHSNRYIKGREGGDQINLPCPHIIL